jgi:hypothetical protein
MILDLDFDVILGPNWLIRKQVLDCWVQELIYATGFAWIDVE